MKICDLHVTFHEIISSNQRLVGETVLKISKRKGRESHRSYRKTVNNKEAKNALLVKVNFHRKIKVRNPFFAK